MSTQSRFIAILFVIGVTMIAAVIYVRDMFVFDHGVEELQRCERTFELNDRVPQLQPKLANDACVRLLHERVLVPNEGRFVLSSHRTQFHDNWLIEMEMTRGELTAVRYGSRNHPQEHPKGAPPDRVSAR